jgi:hypothetical protein
MGKMHQYLGENIAYILRALKEDPQEVVAHPRFKELRSEVESAALKAAVSAGGTVLIDKLPGEKVTKPFLVTCEKGRLYAHDEGATKRQRVRLVTYRGDSPFSGCNDDHLSIEDAERVVKDMWETLSGYDEDELDGSDKRARRFFTNHME